jgi:hypothetical protein
MCLLCVLSCVCQSIVGEVLRAKVEMDRHMQQLGLPLLPFAKAVYVFFLRNYGQTIIPFSFNSL